MYSVGFYTLGCKVSQYETEAIAERFSARGFERRPFDGVCDIYVVNTCTVTAESDRKSRQVIRRAKKNNPSGMVLVCGCYSQRSPKEVSEIDGVFCVIGTENKMTLADVALKLLSEREGGGACQKTVEITDVFSAEFEKMEIKEAPRTRAYVKIEDGCDSKCSYCAISAARGRVRSKIPSDVISEVEYLYSKGTREIVLTGIETGAYGKDFSEKYTLADLLCELDRRGSCERIRLGSLAPELINREFIDKVKDLKILAPHFHLSIQSGSDSVLRGMRRRYNKKSAMDVIEYIREVIPRAAFTTDLMVGFPGESEEDFLETVDFLRRARFIDCHVFAYSKRKGTPAAEYSGQICEEIKRQRSEALIREKNLVRDGVLSDIVLLGETFTAIAESRSEDGVYCGHADNYAEIRFHSDDPNLSGEMVKVRPVSHSNGVLDCELIELI